MPPAVRISLVGVCLGMLAFHQGRADVPWADFAEVGVPIATPTSARSAHDGAKAPELGPVGKLQTLVIETGHAQDKGFTLSGRNSGQQLLVTGKYAAGRELDLTQQVKYQAT